MNTNLESLRIDRPAETQLRAGVSRAWRWGFFALLTIALAAVLYLWRFPPGAGVVEVGIERIAVPDRPGGPASQGTGFSASGWVKLPLRYPVLVTPLIEGRLEEIAVVEGDRVATGQILARLYDRDLRAALSSAEARVQEARAELDKRQRGNRPQEIAEERARVAGLEAQLELAAEVLENSRELQPTGAISLEELLEDGAEMGRLTAELDRAREHLGLIEAGFRAEDIALAEATLRRAEADCEIARLRLGYVEIDSPIDGVVIERRAEVGQWIIPREGAIVSLYDPAELEVRVDVDQDDLARVFPGQRVELSSRAEPGVAHPGRVLLLEPQADVVKNTVPVRVAIERPEEKLLHPDMVVKARFLPAEEEAAPAGGAAGTERPPAISVPVIAVVGAEPELWVFVVREGLARKTRVQLGALEAGRYEVLEGLRGGERVVVRGADALRDGTVVRIEP